MVKQAQTLNPRRWSARSLGRVGLPVVIAVLFSLAVVQLWTKSGDDLRVVTGERHGVEYLQPLTGLMSRLVNAQSVAVRNGNVESADLREALRNVSEVDRTYGDELGSRKRWSDLRNRIELLINKQPHGEVAYREYTDAVDLTQVLINKIADASNLVLDRNLDSHYLMESAVPRLTSILQFAGRAADLGVLGESAGSQSLEVRVAVARYQVSLDSDAIAAGLRTTMDNTASSTLGPGITNQLDTFREAVDGFVPPVTLLLTLDNADPSKVAASAELVRVAADKLMVALLNELDRLLKTRADGLTTDRIQVVGLALLAVLFAAAMLWMRSSGRSAALSEAIARPVGIPEGPPRFDPGARTPEEYETAARPSDELVNVGRGIRARRRERTDDAR